MFSIKDDLAEFASRVDMRLTALTQDVDVETKQISEAMRYSLLGGGKKIRAYLVDAFARLAGGDPELALEFACAMEMVHAYSLIHDDLPHLIMILFI